MSNKVGLLVFSTAMMGFLALVPVAYPEAVASLSWRLGAIAAFLLGVGAIFWQGIIQSREESHNRDLLEAIASNLSLHSPASHSVSPIGDEFQSLRERTAQLAHDLLAFLREKGLEPKDPINNLRTLDTEWKKISEEHDNYVERIHHGYLRLYRNRVVNLLHELAENGISVPIEPFEADPPQAVRAATVRKIAEQLLLCAARME